MWWRVQYSKKERTFPRPKHCTSASDEEVTQTQTSSEGTCFSYFAHRSFSIPEVSQHSVFLLGSVSYQCAKELQCPTGENRAPQTLMGSTSSTASSLRLSCSTGVGVPSHSDLPVPLLIILEHIYFSLSLSYYVPLLISSERVRKTSWMGVHFFHEFTYEKLWCSCKHRDGVIVAFTCECPNILEVGTRWAGLPKEHMLRIWIVPATLGLLACVPLYQPQLGITPSFRNQETGTQVRSLYSWVGSPKQCLLVQTPFSSLSYVSYLQGHTEEPCWLTEMVTGEQGCQIAPTFGGV